MTDSETKTVYAVFTNTDCTEGRGTEYPLYFTEVYETGLRLGKGRYVQGTDCPVKPVTATKIDGRWVVPARIIPPDNDDLYEQDRRIAREISINILKEKGLTDAEINNLLKAL